MAPRRPTKRTKVTDTRSSRNNGDNNPVVAASSYGVVESPAAVAATRTTVDINGIVLSLYNIKTQAQAIKNLKSLEIPLKESKEKCQELFDREGTSAILAVLHRFKKSAKLVEMALVLLLEITYHLEEAASNKLIDLDFHETLLTLAKAHTDSRQIQTNTTCLLGNLSCIVDLQSKMKLGTDVIIQFMRNLMTTFPDDARIVKYACSYFEDMSNIPELKGRLLENEVGQPLMAAFQRFRKWKDDDIDGNEDIKQWVEVLVDFGKRAMVNLLS